MIYEDSHSGGGISLKLTIDDLRRAIVNGGDVSCFAEVYDQALDGAPIPVVSDFDRPLRLPSPYVLAEGVRRANDAPVDSEGPESSDGGVQLRLAELESADGGGNQGLVAVIDDFNPDIIVLDRSPEEMSARALYTFSLPCAVGLSVRMEMIRRGAVEAHFDGDYRPGDPEEAVIIESWKRRIPLLAVGRLPNSKGPTIDKDALQTSSRIKDSVRLFGKQGQSQRVLAIIDPKRHADIEGFSAALMERVKNGQYARQEAGDEKESAIVIGQVVTDPGKTETEQAREATPARQVFANGFQRTINQIAGEVLSPSEATALLTEIVRYTRAHADVERGASVRGTIAFDEIVDALARLNGGLTVECIGKAAMITLPPRVTVRPNAEAEAVIREIANEVLYGVRLSGKIDRSEGEEAASLRPEDIEEGRPGLKKTATLKTATVQKTESFAVVAEKAGGAKSGTGGEKLERADQEMQERYLAAKRELLSLISDLEAKLHRGEITQEEFERHAAGLMAKFRDSVRSAMRMSEGELASTIVQMMDAQDKQWNSEVSFGTMQVYYHIKGTSEREDLGPFKQDYHALKWLIDDLQTGKILRPTSDASGFLLTGLALDVLLRHLMDRRGNDRASRTTRGLDGLSMIERSHEVRRYSRGDRFHDLSIRHTLREIARRKRSLSEVRESDLRVSLKERRRPHSDIILCIDTSGSMGFGQRLTCARLVAAGLVKAAFNDGDRAGIVGFGDRGQTVVPLTKDDGDPLLNGIAALSANGNTNIGDGIKAARDLLLSSGSRNRKQIILITDGQASAVSEAAFQQLSSVRERDITQESALHETKMAAAAGVQVSVVYIAPRDEQIDLFIRKIAETGRGMIHRMSGLEDLENVLCRLTRPLSRAGRTRGL